MGAAFGVILYFMIGIPVVLAFVREMMFDDFGEIDGEDRIMGCGMGLLLSMFWPFLAVWMVVRAPFYMILEKVFPGNDSR